MQVSRRLNDRLIAIANLQKLFAANRCELPISLHAANGKHAGSHISALLGARLASSVASDTDTTKKPSNWRWVMLAPSVVAAYLGYWQTERYSWKVELLDRRKEALKQEAVHLSEIAGQPSEDTRLAVEGVFEHDKSIFVGPRPKTVNANPTAGFVLITPLKADRFGRSVLVNRGWVPAEWQTDSDLRATNTPSEKVHLEGFVRMSEPRSMFVPDNRPESGQWFWIDVPAVAAQAGLPEDTPLIELYSSAPSEERGAVPTSMDVLAFQGKYGPQKTLYPLQKPLAELLDTSVKPLDHRNYALIWFSLSAATAALWYRGIRTGLPRQDRIRATRRQTS